MQPLVALDIFLGAPSEDGCAILCDYDSDRTKPIDKLSDDILITWAQQDPDFRFSQLAAAITPFTTNTAGGAYEWKSIALQLLNLAPDRGKVLAKFGAHLIPWSGSGSLAEIIESRRALVRFLFSHPDPDIADWARETDKKLHQAAEKERDRDLRWDDGFE